MPVRVHHLIMGGKACWFMGGTKWVERTGIIYSGTACCSLTCTPGVGGAAAFRATSTRARPTRACSGVAVMGEKGMKTAKARPFAAFLAAE